MHYLITGGAGFIGSHMADALIDAGHHAVSLDNLSTGQLDNVLHLLDHDRFTHVQGSILDETTLAPLVEACDQVIHLAAVVGVRRVMEAPIETIRTNVQGSEQVLRLAAEHGKKVLIVSSSEVYGKSMQVNGGQHLSEDEDWTLGPTLKRRWAYACTKALDEFMALAYYQEREHPVVIARLFNVVGPRQRGRYGMVIPRFVQQALRNEPIHVHGDGQQTRCFTYVHDAVRAMIGLMQTPAAEGQVFNVGNNKEISIRDLAERIRTLTGSTSEIVLVPYEEVFRPGFEDMRRRTPDLTKLQAVLGFTPAYALDDILNAVIAYYREDPALLEPQH